MNLYNINKGDIFNSYFHLCDVLGEQRKSGNSKIAQIKEWRRYFKFSKLGYKIIIDEIYKSPKLKPDLRSGGNNKIKESLSDTNPKLATEWDTGKNGLLTDDITRRSEIEYWWICSKCNLNILSSPIKRLRSVKGVTDENITCPYCSLSTGAKSIYTFLSYCNFKFIQEYTFEDLKGLNNGYLRFDFAVFNENSLYALIEYDGQFHDEDESSVKIHDRLKDDYCNNKKLQLLRINYRQDENIHLILAKFFLELKQ